MGVLSFHMCALASLEIKKVEICVLLLFNNYNYPIEWIRRKNIKSKDESCVTDKRINS